MSSRRQLCLALFAFAVVFAAALGFALHTDHAWEDYWITFRASRNLAEGQGLVFNPGDRLHTFTSPLGVLLPALAFLLTGNGSDQAALWIFRVMSALALGGAAVLLTRGLMQASFSRWGALGLAALLATDAKILDFTINGMETAFLLLFLAWVFHALLTRPARLSLHLGLAWAGLMWTRPDSFIYIGALGLGVLAFNEPVRTGLTRREWFAVMLRAGIVTSAVYLPWLIFAHLYYGTAVPHTVTAKGLNSAAFTLTRAIDFVTTLPVMTGKANNSFAATFLPAYYMLGGWPVWCLRLAAALSVVVALAWLLPSLRWWARAASFAFLIGHGYLSFVSFFPFPWYLPTTTLLAGVVLAAILQQAVEAAARRSEANHRLTRRMATLAATGLLGVSAWLTFGVARQLEVAQRLIEEGNRRQIGEYLRATARPGDTVFLEPLGCIGYFSGLKTYDFPGLSSREVTAARAAVGSDWAVLIEHLRPDWVVLREHEIAQVLATRPGLFSGPYLVERVFDVSEALRAETIRGRGYLEFDQRFTLLRRQPAGVPAP